MHKRQGSNARSFRAVEDFLDEHGDKFPQIRGSGARRKLRNAVARLEAHATTQRGSLDTAQLGTRRMRALATTLRREHMTPIARIARGELPHTEELLPLRLPKASLSVERLAVAALGMAQTVAPYEQLFIDALLPVDFIARLRAAAEELIVTVDQCSREKTRSSGATKGMLMAIREARQAVVVLDSGVRVALKDNPALLAGWNTAKRVGRVRGAASAADASVPVAA